MINLIQSTTMDSPYSATKSSLFFEGFCVSRAWNIHFSVSGPQFDFKFIAKNIPNVGRPIPEHEF